MFVYSGYDCHPYMSCVVCFVVCCCCFLCVAYHLIRCSVCVAFLCFVYALCLHTFFLVLVYIFLVSLFALCLSLWPRTSFRNDQKRNQRETLPFGKAEKCIFYMCPCGFVMSCCALLFLVFCCCCC